MIPPVATLLGLTWQDWLLVAVSAVVGVGLLFFTARVARNKIKSDRERALAEVARLKLLNDIVAEVRLFMEQLAKEVGKDSGTSLATRLHQQDDALETARVLADKRDEANQKALEGGRVDRIELGRLINALSDALAHLGREVAQNQKFTEHDAAQAARINDLSQSLHAAQIINTIQAPTASNTNVGGDQAGRDKTIGGDQVGNDKTMSQKISGTIEGTIQEAKK